MYNRSIILIKSWYVISSANWKLCVGNIIIHVLWHGLISLLYCGRLQLKYRQPGLRVVVVDCQMVDSVHLTPQFLSHGVQSAVVVHLGRQVVARCQVFETVEIVPVAGPTATGVMVHHLVEHSGDGRKFTRNF